MAICPECGKVIDKVIMERNAMVFNYLYEDGDIRIDRVDEDDDEDYFACPECDEELALEDRLEALSFLNGNLVFAEETKKVQVLTQSQDTTRQEVERHETKHP